MIYNVLQNHYGSLFLLNDIYISYIWQIKIIFTCCILHSTQRDQDIHLPEFLSEGTHKGIEIYQSSLLSLRSEMAHCFCM